MTDISKNMIFLWAGRAHSLTSQKMLGDHIFPSEGMLGGQHSLYAQRLIPPVGGAEEVEECTFFVFCHRRSSTVPTSRCTSKNRHPSQDHTFPINENTGGPVTSQFWLVDLLWTGSPSFTFFLYQIQSPQLRPWISPCIRIPEISDW